MEAPRQNTHMDNMLREFKRLAEAGQDLLSIRLNLAPGGRFSQK